MCPSCHNKGSFTHYIDSETEERLNPLVGICNREINCGYHYPPRQYFQENGISRVQSYQPSIRPKPILVKEPSFIPQDIFRSSFTNREFADNHFIRYLIELFGLELTMELADKYHIGNSSYWKGATVFWQVDILGRVRAGKIMLYDHDTGKRVKSPFKHINWAHKVFHLEGFELKQCFFGEHLLRDCEKPVAIVESEKTAIIASAYFPDFTWIACGSLNQLNAKICSVLKGRRVTLFPDLGCFKKWSEKALALRHIASFSVSDILESKANDQEREDGLDLADYLIRFDVKDFS
jgi:hypothetical protein